MGELKLHNRPVGGYASKKEARRAAELRTLEAAGRIRELREQVPYELIPPVWEDIPQYHKATGRRIKDRRVLVERACKYVAAFAEIATRHCFKSRFADLLLPLVSSGSVWRMTMKVKTVMPCICAGNPDFTADGTAGMNIADLIRDGNERDMCEDCYNTLLERMVKDGA